MLHPAQEPLLLREVEVGKDREEVQRLCGDRRAGRVGTGGSYRRGRVGDTCETTSMGTCSASGGAKESVTMRRLPETRFDLASACGLLPLRYHAHQSAAPVAQGGAFRIPIEFHLW